MTVERVNVYKGVCVCVSKCYREWVICRFMLFAKGKKYLCEYELVSMWVSAARILVSTFVKAHVVGHSMSIHTDRNSFKMRNLKEILNLNK